MAARGVKRTLTESITNNEEEIAEVSEEQEERNEERRKRTRTATNQNQADSNTQSSSIFSGLKGFFSGIFGGSSPAPPTKPVSDSMLNPQQQQIQQIQLQTAMT